MLRILSFFLVLYFSIYHIFAQDGRVTAVLVQQVPDYLYPSIDSLLLFSENLYRIYPDSALLHTEKALQLAYQSKDNLRVAKCLRQKAACLRALGKYEKALKINAEALHISMQLQDNIEIIRNTNDIGDIYALEGNYKWATEQYLEALKMSRTINYKKGIGRSLNDLGSINEAMEQIDKALKYWQESMIVCKEIGDVYGLGTAQKNIALAYFKQHQYNKALYYNQKATANFLLINNIPRYVASLVSTSEVYQAIHEYDSAFFYAQKASYLGQYHKDHHKEALAAINMGGIYAQQNKQVPALKYLHYGFKVAQKYHHKRLAQLAAEKLYVLHKHHQEKDSALFYHELLMVVKDSLLDIEKAQQITALQLSYDLETKHKELAQKEQVIHSQRLMTLGLVVLSALLALLAFSFYFQQRKLNKQNTILEVQNRKIGLQAEQMTQLNNLKDKLFSIISHDLRSPLQNLQGTLELLNTENALKHEEILQITTSIQQQTENVSVVMENLLQWSLAQMKGQKLQITQINLLIATQEAINLLQNIAKNKNITISSFIDSALDIWTDENHLKFIVRNLLANAIKFTPMGGHISLHSKVTGEMVVVSVEDTGVGMTPEQCQSLFNVNTHFSTTGTQAEKGTGLGLLLVKDFVELNGGEVFVKSEVGKGTTFSFTIKRAVK